MYNQIVVAENVFSKNKILKTSFLPIPSGYHSCGNTIAYIREVMTDLNLKLHWVYVRLLCRQKIVPLNSSCKNLLKTVGTFFKCLFVLKISTILWFLSYIFMVNFIPLSTDHVKIAIMEMSLFWKITIWNHVITFESLKKTKCNTCSPQIVPYVSNTCYCLASYVIVMV